MILMMMMMMMVVMKVSLSTNTYAQQSMLDDMTSNFYHACTNSFTLGYT
jgi:hypothetical protein